ncbi:hypothetical protein C1645_821700 [Glomus cerebriforme]|uniref:Protein kinase domain-containing protein n=1 Tax=Glomus cerebriforme TaxID=658196 RepID=A0A397T9R8_9GLOM|nr:hypothetical protein C1645_821700 [Glomus cerebriforme]
MGSLYFKNWTSGNPNIDKLIQESQINAKNGYEKLKWYYRLNQWFRSGNTSVALKSLNNSKDITLEFLNEIKLHLKMNNSSSMIKLYGIMKDSKTSNFVMISSGLHDIYREGLTHQDFHVEKYKKNAYGVLPYVAPEVLRGKKYTQEIPQLIDDLFKQCVDADSSKRLTAQNLNFRCIEWFLESKNMQHNNKLIYTTHSQAIYTSRLLNLIIYLNQKMKNIQDL